MSLDKFGWTNDLFGAFPDGSPKGVFLAGYGVSIFFVLSGFLITYLLLEERSAGEIQIKKFYIRRILRIWPLYYLILICSVITMILMKEELALGSLLMYIFYAANIPFIIGTALPLLAHYWSLGVEEQFYLFWPWVIKKIKQPIPILISATLFLISTKVICHIFYPHSLLENIIHITRFHCMMIGGIAAIWYRERNILFLKIVNHKIVQLLCWAVVILLMANKFHLASVIDNELVSLVAVGLIIGQISEKRPMFSLEKPIFNLIGRISYGIYVIHPLLIFLLSKLVIFHAMPIVLIYVLTITITIICAYFIYEYFERPFLRLKSRFMVVKSKS
jgi:peptidoglycan/LPS O-acetylase OafA/YrhL